MRNHLSTNNKKQLGIVRENEACIFGKLRHSRFMHGERNMIISISQTPKYIIIIIINNKEEQQRSSTSIARKCVRQAHSKIEAMHSTNESVLL
jgi:hypothetical protein